jgi:predicted amidohydrolase
MRIALAQIAPSLGNVPANFDLHLQEIDRARRAQADLVIFPELSLTGYLLKDLVDTVALEPDKDRYFREFKSLSREIGLVLGFVEEKERGLFFNSAALLAGGEILSIHRKVFLPTYGMFEEGKFFAVGRNFRVVPTPWGKAGLMICREFLSYGAHYLLLAQGAELVLAVSAAPGRGLSEAEDFATGRMWEVMAEAMSYFSGSFIAYCNRAGYEDGIAFGGGSFIFNPLGQRLVKAKPAERDFIVQDIDPRETRRARTAMPFLRDDRPEIILHALQRVVDSHED